MPGPEIAAIEPLIAPLRSDPVSAAVLTDIDGTIAPIVERAEDAAVPPETLDVLAGLAGRYGLVACISGRGALAAREMVGLDGIAYSGNHGLELLMPGEEEPRLDPALGDGAGAAAEFLCAIGPAARAAGLRREDKGPIQALHWRGAADEAAAEEAARAIGASAEDTGLTVHCGRKVLELRPPGGAGKDRAVDALLAAGPLATAIYAGDDRTDLDAFRALRTATDDGRLVAAACVGVASDEGPEEIRAEADLVVDGTAGWVTVLRGLAG